jgi:hypothetical protein
MSEPYAGMFQKGEGERGLAPDAHAARSHGDRSAAMSAGQR